MWSMGSARLLLLICIPITLIQCQPKGGGDVASRQVVLSDVRQALDLLEVGNKYIQFDDDCLDSILLVGNRRAGKTTLGTFLTSDGSELEAYNATDVGDIRIRDVRNRTGAHVPKAVPALMTDKERNFCVYDCPSFRHSRPLIEFVNSIFIRKIVDRVGAVKIVLVVNYSSVKPGETGTDFLNLIQSTLRLIRDVSVFSGSVTLVATKVDNAWESDKVVQAIRNFLMDFKKSLPEVFSDDKDVTRATILLDSILSLHGPENQQQQQRAQRIALFRVPTKEGKLSEMTEMAVNKREIESVIHNGTDFVATSAEDFGYAVAGQSIVPKIMEILQDDMDRRIGSLLSKLVDYYTKKISRLPQTDSKGLPRILELQQQITEGRQQLESILSRAASNNFTLDDDVRRIKALVERSGIPLSMMAVTLQKLGDQSTLLRLLLASDGGAEVLEPPSPSEQFASHLGNATAELARLSETINEHLFKTYAAFMHGKLDRLTKDFFVHFTSRVSGFRNVDVDNSVEETLRFYKKLEQGAFALRNLTLNSVPLMHPEHAPEFLGKIHDVLVQMDAPPNVTSALEAISAENLLWLQYVTPSVDASSCLDLLNRVADYLVDTHELLRFKLLASLTRAVQLDTQRLATRLIRYYVTNSNSGLSTDPIQYAASIARAKAKFSELAETPEPGEGFAEALQGALDDLNITLPTSFRLTNSIAQSIQLLRTVSPSVFVNPGKFAVWTHELRPLVRHLSGLNQWMVFLTELKECLSGFPPHANLTAAQQLVEIDWTEGDMIPILRRIKTVLALPSLMAADSMSLLESTKSDLSLRYLKNIVMYSLAQPTCEVEEEDKLRVVGRTVALSQVLSCLRGPVRRITVLAAYSFVMDTSFNSTSLGKHPDFYVISPNLIAPQPQYVDLTGQGGPFYRSPQENAAEDGLAGLPGKNGANFFGMVDKIYGQLRIISNGGRGGKGQDVYGRIYRTGLLYLHNFRCLSPSPVQGRSCCLDDHVYPNNFRRPGSPGIGGYPGRIQLIAADPESPGNLTSVRKTGGAGLHGGLLKVANFKNWCHGLRMADTKSDIFTCRPTTRGSGNDSGSWIVCPINPNHRFDHEPLKFNGDNRAQPRAPNFAIRTVIPEVLRFKAEAMRAAHEWTRDELASFVTWMENSAELADAYKPSDLIQEFLQLEQAARTSRADVTPYFESLQSRIYDLSQRLVEQSPSADRSDSIEALAFLHAASLSSKLSVSSGLEPILVVDMRAHLESEEEKLEQLYEAGTELQRAARIQAVTLEYTRPILQKFEEANRFIETEILPEMDVIERRINSTVNALLLEIQRLKLEEGSNLEILQRNQEALRRQILINSLFSGFKLAGNVLSFLGPKGATAGALLNSGLSNMQSLIPKEKQLPTKNVTLPAVILQREETVTARFTTQRRRALKNFVILLKFVNNTLAQHPETFQKVIDYVALASSRKNISERSLYAHARELDMSDNIVTLLESESLLSETRKQLYVLLEEVKVAEASRSGKRSTGDPDPSQVKSLVEKVQAIVSTGGEFLSALQEDSEGLDEMAAQVQETAGRMNRLEEHKQKVIQRLLPELAAMLREFDSVAVALRNQSYVTLDVKRWKVQNIIRDVKLALEVEYLDGTGLERQMARALDKLEDALTTMIQLYDRMETFKDQAALANFLTNLNHATNAGDVRIRDSALKRDTKQLLYNIQASTFLERQKLLFDSFRLWMFPLEDAATCNLTRVDLTGEKLPTEQGFHLLLDDARSRLQRMEDEVKTSKNTIQLADRYRIQGAFSHLGPFPPFFTWANSTHFDYISDLLEGESVFLYANVHSGPDCCDAVKFRSIGLHFTARHSAGDLEREAMEMETALKDYTVEMTHQGNSYYRLRTRTYTIPSAKIQLFFSFEQDSKHERPAITSSVYNKVLEGDVLLSPYAFWEVKLSRIDRSANFTSLSRFKNKFDLDLIGEGTCMRPEHEIEAKGPSQSCQEADSTALRSRLLGI